jgi:hypothetical protein
LDDLLIRILVFVKGPARPPHGVPAGIQLLPCFHLLLPQTKIPKIGAIGGYLFLPRKFGAIKKI